MKSFALILAVLLTSIVSACGGGSPSDVAKGFYKAANEGNYEKAKDYLSVNLRMASEMFGLGFGGGSSMELENMMDGATKNGKIARIEVKGGQDYSGAAATVYLTLHYTNGGQAQDVLTLMREDGKWRIAMSVLLVSGGAFSP